MPDSEDRTRYVLDAIARTIVQEQMPTMHQVKQLAEGATCDTCGGSGLKLWSDTAMGSGPGGQSMTLGPCPGQQRAARDTDCPFVEPPHPPRRMMQGIWPSKVGEATVALDEGEVDWEQSPEYPTGPSGQPGLDLMD